MSLTPELPFLGTTLTEGAMTYHSKIPLRPLEPSSASSTLPPPPPTIMASSSSVPQSLLFTHLFSLALFGNNNNNNNSDSNSTSAEMDFNEQHSSSSSPLSASSSSFSYSSSPSAMALASPSYQRSPSEFNSKSLKFQTQKLPVKPPLREDSTLALINGALAQYFDPVAIGVGILGNCLLCLVFLLTPLRARPLSHVLSGLGIIDFVYVISCLMVYLSSKGKPVYEAPGACNMTMFATMLSRTLQSWYMLIAHVDRINAHFGSSFERRKRRVFNTKFTLLLTALLAAALSVHVLWSFETKEYAGRTYCVPMRDSIEYYMTFRKVYVVISVVCPLTIIAGVDLILILKLTLYIMCKDDFDEDDIIDNIDGYTGHRHSGDSSFCTDKIVRFPLHEKKSNSYEHIFTNGKAGTNQLATIKEISSDKDSSSLRGMSPKRKGEQKNLDFNSDLEIINEKFTASAEKLSKFSSQQDRQVAQYILTLTEDYGDRKGSEAFAHFTVKTKQLLEEKNAAGKDEWPKLQSEDDNQTNKDHSEVSQSNSPTRHLMSNRINKSGRLKHSYTHYSQSMSHIRSCDFTSFASNASRNTVIPDDHIFPDDVVACSLVTVFSGLAFAALIIPSSYLEGRSLFLSPSPNSRPTPDAIQQAILFESIVKFNAIYKVLVYFLALSSFRQAFLWILTDWIPRKITVASKLRAFSTHVDNDIVFV